jgi:hypothetical protein
MKISLLTFALLAAHATASYIRSCNNCRLEKRSAALYVKTYLLMLPSSPGYSNLAANGTMYKIYNMD